MSLTVTDPSRTMTGMANGTVEQADRQQAVRTSTGSRLASLDGLRGIAAMVVVVHHALLTWPVLYAQYAAPNRGSATWWLTFTPLHITWAGREAVTVFFILSGIVLVLPYLGPKKVGTWPGYLVRRVMRLYPPVAAALVLSVALVAAFPRDPVAGATSWYARHDIDLTWSGFFSDLVLINGTGMTNSVLWSLRYEVAFSLLLPIVILAVRRLPRRLWLTFPASMGLVVLAQYSGNHWAAWLSIFGVGVAMAMGLDDLRRLAAWIERSPFSGVVWAVLTTSSVALLLAEWVFRGLHVPTATWVVNTPPMVALGGALACFIVLGWPAADRLFSGRFLQWAGRISFSLYLVHEPVAVSIASLVTPGTVGALVTLVLTCVISVALAVLLHRYVEAPCQRWSRDLGKGVDRFLGPRGRHRGSAGALTARPHAAAAPQRPRITPRPASAAEVGGLVDAR